MSEVYDCIVVGTGGVGATLYYESGIVEVGDRDGPVVGGVAGRASESRPARQRSSSRWRDTFGRSVRQSARPPRGRTSPSACPGMASSSRRCSAKFWPTSHSTAAPITRSDFWARNDSQARATEPTPHAAPPATQLLRSLTEGVRHLVARLIELHRVGAGQVRLLITRCNRRGNNGIGTQGDLGDGRLSVARSAW